MSRSSSLGSGHDGGREIGPDAATEEGKQRLGKLRTSSVGYKKYFIGLIERFEKNPNDGMISKLVLLDLPQRNFQDIQAMGQKEIYQSHLLQRS